MNSFYSNEELEQLGICSIGQNVLISRKSSIYEAENIIIGNHVRIDDFCILSGKITIGNYIHIAAYTALYGGKDGIAIRDYANLSSRVTVYSISDDYSGETMTNPMVPEKYKKVQSEAVEIGRHVIIGSGCVILPGTILQEGSAFGAMSLINRNSEPWSMNAGIPFRRLKERSRKLLDLEKIFDKECHEWIMQFK